MEDAWSYYARNMSWYGFCSPLTSCKLGERSCQRVLLPFEVMRGLWQCFFDKVQRSIPPCCYPEIIQERSTHSRPTIWVAWESPNVHRRKVAASSHESKVWRKPRQGQGSHESYKKGPSSSKITEIWFRYMFYHNQMYDFGCVRYRYI